MLGTHSLDKRGLLKSLQMLITINKLPNETGLGRQLESVSGPLLFSLTFPSSHFPLPAGSTAAARALAPLQQQISF